MDKQNATLKAFYRNCLTVNPDTNVTETLQGLLADNFVSSGSVDSKTKADLIGQIGFFWKLIPDMKWEPQEMICQGNKFVVRSIASGTPNGDFMGLPTDGTKSFRIMTIDIHTLENDKMVSVHHLEDWGTAMKQLKS